MRITTKCIINNVDTNISIHNPGNDDQKEFEAAATLVHMRGEPSWDATTRWAISYIRTGDQVLIQDTGDTKARFFPATIKKIGDKTICFVWDGYRMNGKPIEKRIKVGQADALIRAMPPKEILKTLPRENIRLLDSEKKPYGKAQWGYDPRSL